MVNFFSELINFFYPDVCAACNNGLFKGENVICTPCLFHLPKTNFHVLPGNAVEKQFWGKVNVYSATALYYFNKGERVQHLVHRLKYFSDKEVGVFTGKILGTDLLIADRFATVDAIVPVPLHANKLRIRGFNQSDFFAKGLSEAMNVPFISDYLIRIKATSTQTKKSRFSRFENVNRVFEINPLAPFTPAHILLVDDVITTGSTLAACADVLLEVPAMKVSIATIAYARL